MAERLNLSGDELRNRKSFFGLSGEEETSLQLLRPLFQKTIPAFVTLLQKRIGTFPEIARILEKAHSESWLSSRHAEYFIELVSGPYDMAYVHNRLAVGISHPEIGLGPEWVQASFGLFLEWACRTLREEPVSPLSANPRLSEILRRSPSSTQVWSWNPTSWLKMNAWCFCPGSSRPMPKGSGSLMENGPCATPTKPPKRSLDGHPLLWANPLRIFLRRVPPHPIRARRC